MADKRLPGLYGNTDLGSRINMFTEKAEVCCAFLLEHCFSNRNAILPK